MFQDELIGLLLLEPQLILQNICAYLAENSSKVSLSWSPLLLTAHELNGDLRARGCEVEARAGARVRGRAQGRRKENWVCRAATRKNVADAIVWQVGGSLQLAVSRLWCSDRREEVSGQSSLFPFRSSLRSPFPVLMIGYLSRALSTSAKISGRYKIQFFAFSFYPRCIECSRSSTPLCSNCQSTNSYAVLLRDTRGSGQLMQTRRLVQHLRRMGSRALKRIQRPWQLFW